MSRKRTSHDCHSKNDDHPKNCTTGTKEKKNICSVYSFSSSCPKTVSRTREVFPTGSTTLLRLQLSRTRDCAHRSRHVGFFFFFFFFWRERFKKVRSSKTVEVVSCKL